MGLARARSRRTVQGIEHIRNARLRPQDVAYFMLTFFYVRQGSEWL